MHPVLELLCFSESANPFKQNANLFSAVMYILLLYYCLAKAVPRAVATLWRAVAFINDLKMDHIQYGILRLYPLHLLL